MMATITRLDIHLAIIFPMNIIMSIQRTLEGITLQANKYKYNAMCQYSNPISKSLCKNTTSKNTETRSYFENYNIFE